MTSTAHLAAVQTAAESEARRWRWMLPRGPSVAAVAQPATAARARSAPSPIFVFIRIPCELACAAEDTPNRIAGSHEFSAVRPPRPFHGGEPAPGPRARPAGATAPP